MRLRFVPVGLSKGKQPNKPTHFPTSNKFAPAYFVEDDCSSTLTRLVQLRRRITRQSSQSLGKELRKMGISIKKSWFRTTHDACLLREREGRVSLMDCPRNFLPSPSATENVALPIGEDGWLYYRAYMAEPPPPGCLTRLWKCLSFRKKTSGLTRLDG